MLRKETMLSRRFTSFGLAVLAGCGGGQDGLDAGSGEWAISGPVTGFGSSAVNGMRIDDAPASFTNDDGDAMSPQDLRQGMVVEVRGRKTAPSRGAKAGSQGLTSVHVVSEIRGPVEAVTGEGSLTVLGQAVSLRQDAFFEVGLTFEDIAVGDVLEVYGTVTGKGQVRATRVEREGSGDAGFKLRGFIGGLDPARRIFGIGQASISYARIANTPALRTGDFVRVQVESVQVGGRWIATRIEVHRAPTNIE